MKIEIRSRFTGNVLLDVEAASLRVALEAAVTAGATLRGADLGDANLGGANLRGADLGGADLGGANLGGANLGGAKNAETCWLDTGERLSDYIATVMPALCTAGGKTLEEVAAGWACHSWDNCPMAIAFGVTSEDAVPALYRPRVRQFVQLFDAGLLPSPVPTTPGAETCPA